MMSASRSLRRPSFAPLAIAAWCAIPAVELLSLSLAFDGTELLREGNGPSGTAALVAWAPNVGRLSVVFAFAMLLHGGMAWGEEFRRLLDLGACRRGFARLSFMLWHGCAFGVFAAITRSILTPGLADATGVRLASLFWPLSGASVLATWCLILAPPADWAELVRRRGKSLIVGVAIATLAWAAGLVTQRLWATMADATVQTSRFLLGLLGQETVVEMADRVLGTSAFQVRIAPQCSGYEGIGLLWVILGTYLWLARDAYRFPRSLLLFPLGTLLIWLANSARIASLILLGTHVSADMAISGFHSQAGWIALNLVTFGLIGAASRWRWLRPAESGASARTEATTVNPTAPYVAPLVVVLATALTTSAFTVAGAPDLAYGLRVLSGFAALAYFRPSYRGTLGPFGRKELGWGTLSGVAVFALWMALEPRNAGPSGMPATLSSLPGILTLGWIALKVLGSVVLIPMVEELAFRGFAIRRLISADFDNLPLSRMTWPALLISSFLFGAMHDRWLAGTLAGLCFGASLRRGGSLWEAILAHAVANALIAATVLSFGSWSLW